MEAPEATLESFSDSFFPTVSEKPRSCTNY